MPFRHSNQQSSDKGVPILSPNLRPQYWDSEFMTNLFLITNFICGIQTNINLLLEVAMEVVKYLGSLALFCFPLACWTNIVIDSPNSEYSCGLRQNFLLGNSLKRIPYKISLIQQILVQVCILTHFLTLLKPFLRHTLWVPRVRV